MLEKQTYIDYGARISDRCGERALHEQWQGRQQIVDELPQAQVNAIIGSLG